jgi:hypothetical protein
MTKKKEVSCMGVYLRGKSWYINFYEDGKRYTEGVGQVSKGVANVDFRNAVIIVEKTKNDDIRKIPMNQKLTQNLEGAKKVFKNDYVFSKTGWWTPEHKRKAVEILEKVTSNFTTQANPDENSKVVSLRNH